jgi:hypothetical protein
LSGLITRELSGFKYLCDIKEILYESDKTVTEDSDYAFRRSYQGSAIPAEKVTGSALLAGFQEKVYENRFLKTLLHRGLRA